MKVRNLVKLVAAVAVTTVLSGGNALASIWGHSSGIFGGNFGNQNRSVPFLGHFSGRLKGKTDVQELTKEASAGRLKVAVQKNNDGSGDYCGFYGTGRDGFTPTIRIVPCNGDKKIGSNWFCPIGKTMVAIAQADTWGHDGKNHHVAFTCVDTPPGVQDPTPDGRRIILNWHGWKIAYGPKDAWTGVEPDYATANSIKKTSESFMSQISSVNSDLEALKRRVEANTSNITYNRERIDALEGMLDSLNMQHPLIRETLEYGCHFFPCEQKSWQVTKIEFAPDVVFKRAGAKEIRSSFAKYGILVGRYVYEECDGYDSNCYIVSYQGIPMGVYIPLPNELGAFYFINNYNFKINKQKVTANKEVFNFYYNPNPDKIGLGMITINPYDDSFTTFDSWKSSLEFKKRTKDCIYEVDDKATGTRLVCITADKFLGTLKVTSAPGIEVKKTWEYDFRDYIILQDLPNQSD